MEGLRGTLTPLYSSSGTSKMDSPILSHESRHKPGESRTSSRPGRPAVRLFVLFSLQLHHINHFSNDLFMKLC